MYNDYAVSAARADAAFAFGVASRARADRAAAEARARAARRGGVAAGARLHVVRDANEDLRAQLAEAQSLIQELCDDNQRLRADAAAMADFIAEHAS